jgi:hypothetical protein
MMAIFHAFYNSALDELSGQFPVLTVLLMGKEFPLYGRLSMCSAKKTVPVPAWN